MNSQNTEILTLNDPQIVIRKGARTLELFDGDTLINSYSLVLGFTPIGDKEIEGDGKTPEGEFYVFTKNPKSKFYLSLGISYPSTDDAERGLEQELISREEFDSINDAVSEKKTPPQKTRLGGEIYIHGGGTASDWTEGCVALENGDIAELFEAVPVGTPVTILP